MKLETKRLELIPLNGNQLAMLLWDEKKLEEELHCGYEGSEVSGPVALAVEGQYDAIKSLENEQDYLFYTFWQIMVKKDRTIVGSICVKSPPNERGEVEIGYGLNPLHEKQGYMTEAAEALFTWLLSQPGVRAVVAETSKYNEASHSVLKRCGMKIAKSSESELWWLLSRAI